MDLLKLINITTLLNDQKISNHDLVEMLGKALTPKQLRGILVRGIIDLYHDPSQSNVIDKVHKHVWLFKNNNVAININKYSIPMIKSNANCSKIKPKRRSISKVFKTQDLVCKINQYLDFKSLLTCSTVNKQFLFDSYNLNSIGNLNLIVSDNVYLNTKNNINTIKNTYHNNVYYNNTFYFNNIPNSNTNKNNSNKNGNEYMSVEKALKGNKNRFLEYVNESKMIVINFTKVAVARYDSLHDSQFWSNHCTIKQRLQKLLVDI